MYVDDFMILSPADEIQAGLIKELQKKWNMSTNVFLSPATPITFLGMEIERESKTGDLLIHQQSFVRQLLTKHGIDRNSKPMTAIVVTTPEATDKPPTPLQLKQLQAYAGEFNWLATRTRSDLAYYTSVIASTACKYAEWTLQLCKKVLRYICGTVEVGLRYPSTGTEFSLVSWSDAGFGGVSTKSQTGELVSWGGAVVTWRSSRQPTDALSTCEAEVSAAAMGFQIVEGLKCLLEEWEIKFSAPILLIDNKSALTLFENGGTWRTRYFAIKAARLQQEHQNGNLILRYCPTLLMAADGLTKMGSAIILEKFRQCMNASLPTIPKIP